MWIHIVVEKHVIRSTLGFCCNNVDASTELTSANSVTLMDSKFKFSLWYDSTERVTKVESSSSPRVRIFNKDVHLLDACNIERTVSAFACRSLVSDPSFDPISHIVNCEYFVTFYVTC